MAATGGGHAVAVSLDTSRDYSAEAAVLRDCVARLEDELEARRPKGSNAFGCRTPAAEAPRHDRQSERTRAAAGPNSSAARETEGADPRSP